MAHLKTMVSERSMIFHFADLLTSAVFAEIVAPLVISVFWKKFFGYTPTHKHKNTQIKWTTTSFDLPPEGSA